MARGARLLAALGAAFVLCLTCASASASTASSYGPLIEHWNGTAWMSVPNPNIPSGSLSAVTAISARDLWAVGNTCCQPTVPLAEHWNGSSWRQVAVPHSPGNSGVLNAVAASSSRDVWAVGFMWPGGCCAFRTLIEHWNGRRWKQVPSPRAAGPGVASYLSGVSALSSTDAWAVGWYEVCPGPRYCVNAGDHALVLHWNGRRWRRVTRPLFAQGTLLGGALAGVAAVSARDLWAAGVGRGGPLAVRWNGERWKSVPNPRPGSGFEYRLNAVAVTASKDAWAVGEDAASGSSTPLAEHWDGRTWTIVPVPATPLSSSGGYTPLLDVATVSADDAWAVGTSVTNTNCAAIAEHWDGHTWTQIPIQAAQPSCALSGVAALSPTNVWAVGQYDNPN